MDATVTTNTTLWSEEKLQHLQEQLVGMWAEDVWSVTSRDGDKTAQRLIHFDLPSPSLTIEWKYALWRYIEGRKSGGNTDLSHLYYGWRHLAQWLKHLPPSTHSLLERNADAWVCLLRTFLVEQGIFRPKHGKRLTSKQCYEEDAKDDRRIYLFRVLYRLLLDGYDDRPETEKDIWDLRKWHIEHHGTVARSCLNFTQIRQPWLREVAKCFMKYRIAIYSPADCLVKMSDLRQFSIFLAEYHPQAQPSSIDQRLILEYMSYLKTLSIQESSFSQHLVSLRVFLETCALRLQLPGFPRERLILDEDLPKRPERATREIPEEVLEQLREHLDALPTMILRMVTILLEMGLRISELCSLRLDCLVCDDRHEWYLKVYQWKVKRERVIPLVEERVIGAIQAQQQEVREKWEERCSYLFPSTSSPLQKPFQQRTFTDIVNRWAVKHQIKDRAGALYRFTAHQFRHTVGMRLINDNVPMETVSRLLGHRSLRMTMVYARVRDQKLRADLERAARKRKTVDYQGNEVKGDLAANDPEAQMLRKGIRGQTLPIGGCGRLVVLGECSHANKCLTCPMWLTSTDDLPALTSFYKRALRLKERAEQVGNRFVIEQQGRIITTLAVRVKSLEQTEMNGTLCVDEVLAQLHADLAETMSGLEEAQEAGLVLAAKHLSHIVADLKARIKALEEAV